MDARVLADGFNTMIRVRYQRAVCMNRLVREWDDTGEILARVRVAVDPSSRPSFRSAKICRPYQSPYRAQTSHVACILYLCVWKKERSYAVKSLERDGRIVVPRRLAAEVAQPARNPFRHRLR